MYEFLNLFLLLLKFNVEKLFFDKIVKKLNFQLIHHVFLVGNHPTKGIQGMKYTRPPVEYLVSQAQNMKSNEILPSIKFEVTPDGVNYKFITEKKNPSKLVSFNASSISYCVQDVKYSRVFSMIIVAEDGRPDTTLFTCHSFLCESSNQARKITCALSVALQYCGEKMKGIKKKVIVDLRTAEDLGKTNMDDDEMEA